MASWACLILLNRRCRLIFKVIDIYDGFLCLSFWFYCLVVDNHLVLDEFEGDEDARAYFPCPFCYVEIEVNLLCSHLQIEHCFDLKNAVTTPSTLLCLIADYSMNLIHCRAQDSCTIWYIKEKRGKCSEVQVSDKLNLLLQKFQVCPLCAANLGKDATGHFTAQHASSLKVSFHRLLMF